MGDCFAHFAVEFRDENLCWTARKFPNYGGSYCFAGIANAYNDIEVCNHLDAWYQDPKNSAATSTMNMADIYSCYKLYFNNGLRTITMDTCNAVKNNDMKIFCQLYVPGHPKVACADISQSKWQKECLAAEKDAANK